MQWNLRIECEEAQQSNARKFERIHCESKVDKVVESNLQKQIKFTILGVTGVLTTCMYGAQKYCVLNLLM